MKIEPYTIYNKSSGVIRATIYVRPDLLSLNIQEGEGYVSGEYDVDKYKITDGLPTEIDDLPQKRLEFKQSIIMKRDALLQSSDWTQVADAPVDQAAWAVYRQALRDIPQQEGFPDDVAWPVQP